MPKYGKKRGAMLASAKTNKKRRTTRIPKKLFLSNTNSELKAVDYASNQGFVLNLATTGVTLNAVNAGTDFYNRIGRKTVNTSVHLKGIIYNTQAASVAQNIRLVVVYDKESAAGAVGWSDVFQSVDYTGATNAGSQAGRNLNNRDRFIVLIDEKRMVGAVGAAGALIAESSFPTSHEMQIDRYVKINLPSIHSGAAASATSMTTGQILLLLQGDGAVGADWYFRWNSRVRFADS